MNDPETQPFVQKSLNKMRQMLSPKRTLLRDDPEVNIDGKTFYLASFNKRLLASSVDMILISILMIPLSQMIAMFGLGDELMQIQMKPELLMNDIDGATMMKILFESGVMSHILLMQGIIGFLIGFSMVWFWSKKGATPGKMLFRCKVLNADNLQNITYKQGIVRFLSLPLSILPLLIGLFMIDFTKNRQSLHDKIAKTIVVYSSKK